MAKQPKDLTISVNLECAEIRKKLAHLRKLSAQYNANLRRAEAILDRIIEKAREIK